MPKAAKVKRVYSPAKSSVVEINGLTAFYKPENKDEQGGWFPVIVASRTLEGTWDILWKDGSFSAGIQFLGVMKGNRQMRRIRNNRRGPVHTYVCSVNTSLKKNRVPVSELQRRCVAFRQNWKCKQCDNILTPVFHVDHIIPISQGGEGTEMNLQALCPNCHALKTAAERRPENEPFLSSCAVH